MTISRSHVLVIGHPSEDLQPLLGILNRLCCSTDVAVSVEQVMLKVKQRLPHLVILSDNHHHDAPAGLVRDLRSLKNSRCSTIVALTDCHSPSWMPLEDVPGIDGFLVKPLNIDVLTSLVQSALARQTCTTAFCQVPL
jgi:DNA-binding response OmpR family regulator